MEAEFAELLQRNGRDRGRGAEGSEAGHAVLRPNSGKCNTKGPARPPRRRTARIRRGAATIELLRRTRPPVTVRHTAGAWRPRPVGWLPTAFIGTQA